MFELVVDGEVVRTEDTVRPLLIEATYICQGQGFEKELTIRLAGK